MADAERGCRRRTADGTGIVDGPRRQRDRQQRQRQQTGNRHRPHPVARRGRRAAPERTYAVAPIASTTGGLDGQRIARNDAVSRMQGSSGLSLRTSALKQRAQPLVLALGERRAVTVQQRRHRRSRSSCRRSPHQLPQRRPAGVLEPWPRGSRRTAGRRTRGQQAALDHDVEQLAHARRARRIGQLRADLFDRRAAAPVEDLHDLAFAAGQIDSGRACAWGLG